MSFIGLLFRLLAASFQSSALQQLRKLNIYAIKSIRAKKVSNYVIVLDNIHDLHSTCFINFLYFEMSNLKTVSIRSGSRY